MMKTILTIFFLLLIGLVVNAQTRPIGNPSVLSTNGWYKIAFVESDSGLIIRPRDTGSFFPRFTGTIVMQPNIRKFFYYDSTDLRWYSLSTTANNGLTITGNNAQLGGTLIQSTDINNGGNLFYIHGTGQNIFRTQNGTFQANIATSGVGAAITASNSSTNLFSEINAVEGNAYLVGGKNGVFYNEVHADSNRIYFVTKSNTAPKRVILDTLGYVTYDAYPSLTQETDTTTFKPIGINSSGKQVPMAYWPRGSASGSGLTSVGLSLPSAFTVTNSPLTSNGVLNVIGAGTTAQYIRGNGTLATTDTGMIPNFYLKVRSLVTGTSPITFNQTTGAIGISNANTSGTKGAASFSSSYFTDNGSGLIGLTLPINAGSCTNCNLTLGADGRVNLYSNGSGGSGSGVDTMYRTAGVDSIYFTINGGAQRAIKDSTGGAGGTVTNVSGTTNRITVTNPTTTPVIDIAATYVGQTSITTLGTIATGVWNGTAIGATFGGTGQTTVTTGDLLYGSATNTWSKLADIATGNALISGGVTTAPSWGKIGLTTHISGILPIANGGTATATPALVAGTNISITGSWPNQTINATGSGTIQSQQSITGDGSSGNKVRFVNDVTIPKKGDVYTAVVGYDSSRGWQQWEENFRGDIYNNNSWSSFSTGFTNTGSVTGNIVNSNLHFTGGSLYGSLALTTPYTAIDNYIITDTVVINEKSGTSYGSGVGTVSVNNSTGASNIDIFLRFLAYTGGGSGTLALTVGFAHNIVSTSSAITFSVGDTLLRTFTRDGWSYTGSIRNLTTNSAPVSITPYTFTSSGDVMPNTGRFAVFFLGGEFTINSLKISSYSSKNARLLLKGDSRMVGYTVTSQTVRLGDLLNNNYKNTIISAGGFDRTTEALLTLPEDSLLYPEQALICLGYNDLATGTSLATTEANLDSIYNFYIAHNIDAYFLLVGTVSPATSTTALNAYLRSTYPTRVFDCEQLMFSTGALQADGVHWSDYGNRLLRDFITQSYRLYGGNTRYGNSGGIGGTPNYFSMFTTPSSVGDAPMYQDGTRITATLPFEQHSTNPDFVWFETDGGSDEKIWSTEVGSGVMNWRTVNDGRSAATNFMQFTRSGNDISLMRFLKLSRFEGGVQLYNIVSGSSSDSILVQELGTGNVKRIAPITGGISTLNTLTALTQTFATGTSGSDFNISSATSTHTFNIPDAATGARGLVTTGTQTFGGLKTFNSGATILAPFTLTLGSDATGDTYYRTGGTIVRRAIGSTDDVYTVSGGVPIWQAPNYSYGTYTPTITSVTNITTTTAYQCQYMRVGNVVTVSGKVDIDPAGTGSCAIAISIPIASALANDFECGGTGDAGAVPDLHGSIKADPTNDRVELDFTIPVAGTITNQSWYFSFTYYIDIT